MLNFSNDEFRRIALNTRQVLYETERTVEDAFLLFIKDFDKGNKESLENLCKYIKKFFAKVNIKLSLDDCYELTQGRDIEHSIIFNESIKSIILACAYECIYDGNLLGTRVIGESNNTSNCLNHVLYHGEASRILAEAIGLNGETAQKLGILHDIGRKRTHSIMHMIAGFELLQELGWCEESFVSLYHSFTLINSNNDILKGGRCANCDPTLDGYRINEKGNEVCEKEEYKDDIARCLDIYEYSLYDLIMNIADCMAANEGIVSMYNRIFESIMPRREPGSFDMKYTLIKLTNEMRYYLKRAGLAEFEESEIEATKDIPLEQVTALFEEMSEFFFDKFNELRCADKEFENVENSLNYYFHHRESLRIMSRAIKQKKIIL